MVFSSILFLCFFLPIVLLIYYLVPGKVRNIILLAASLLFYAWGEPKYILIMVFSTVFDYTNGRLLLHWDKEEKKRKAVLFLSVTVNLGILGLFKYTDFTISNINALAGTNFNLLKLALPIGISFYTFQTLSYTIDVYRRKVDVQKNILDFGMYICLFPQLIAGPIVRYADVEKQIRGRQESVNCFWNGLVRFSVGLGKKVLLANQIGTLWEELSGISNPGTATAWIGALAYTFQIYFDFSGYSDMAIGLGMMFGFRFPENFLHPYEADSVTDFWRRWHVTLGTWFREYLYIPLGGNRKGLSRQIINLLIVWALTGIWHGAGWNFLLWGLLYFALLVFEKTIGAKVLKHLPKWIGHVYTMFFVVFGWMLFANDDFSKLKGFLIGMFGGNGLADSTALYYVTNYGLLFLILIVGCTSLPLKVAGWVRTKVECKQSGFFVLQLLFVVGVIWMSFVFLVGDSYNPFLYFRF